MEQQLFGQLRLSHYSRLFVEAQDGELTIGLNNGNIPELHVSRDYQDMFDDYSSNKQNQTQEKRDALLFVKQKLDAAQWFVNAVKQRQETLLSTIKVIVDLQKIFPHRRRTQLETHDSERCRRTCGI